MVQSGIKIKNQKIYNIQSPIFNINSKNIIKYKLIEYT